MIDVFVEVNAGSADKNVYDEKTFEHKGIRKALRTYPYAYGFIKGTMTDDGEGVDCYILTRESLEPATEVRCEAAGLLEFFEENEEDHKVLALLPGQELDLSPEIRDELREFIYDIFKTYPDMRVRVGEILSKDAALDYIERNRQK